MHDSLRLEVTASMANISDRNSAEMLEIQGHLANLVQGMTNMVTTLWLKMLRELLCKRGIRFFSRPTAHNRQQKLHQSNN
ncbi:Hypothetical protein PHPALM_37412 [Phytophthora palmivora]|uniref:Uncharacterized protein n=1 Tax=Phytophthora palmivora TaxID=4796 RepID=A0A2P4WXI3_9STRA|nr:Hypothetical protein PHPALM_37412 [Phytophthora palmivora]